MIRREPHTNNGKFVGMWYHFPDGRQMYLAHYSGEKTKGSVPKRNAWYVDRSILREAERRGCFAVGVLHRIGKHKYFYLTNRADFWKLPAEDGIYQSMSQRILPKSRFMVTPAHDRKLIEEQMFIR